MHEDHIGAVPTDLGVPIYATPFTADLVRGLDEAGLLDQVEVDVISDDHGSFAVGPFEITYLPPTRLPRATRC